MMMRVFLAGLAVYFSLGLAWVAAADTVLFILDVSGSMRGKLDGGTKMDAAKRTFGKLLDSLPKNLQVGVEVYGHRGDRDCSAIEVMVPPQPLDGAAVKAKVQGLTPRKGATPIADALATAGETLRGTEGGRTIVLISDGKETCGGDPEATAARLRKEGIGVKIHVVGFGVGEKERKQLQAVAKAGGGNYYDAKNAAGLQVSMQQVAQQVTEKPAEPETKVLVKDGFDAEYLAEHWELKNPNPDAIIVENGMLQILTDLPKDNLFEPTNLVLLKKELPRQWEAILRMRYTMLNAPYYWDRETQLAGLILYRDKNKGIMLTGSPDGEYRKKQAVRFVKVRNGKWVPGFSITVGPSKEEREVVLRLQRIKRKFIASFLNEKGKWQKIGEFTELRPKYKLGIFALRGSGDAREALEKFDEFTFKEIQ
ncbi:MAG: VWA domain-containing protein [Candidatus Binatia bacterium]